jgi:hypothetical protein
MIEAIGILFARRGLGVLVEAARELSFNTLLGTGGPAASRLPQAEPQIHDPTYLNSHNQIHPPHVKQSSTQSREIWRHTCHISAIIAPQRQAVFLGYTYLPIPPGSRIENQLA